MELLNALNWRYAAKKMNGNSVPDHEVSKIVEAAYLAPSSSGLQPFEIICISNQELKQKIHPIAFQQSQILDASHLLVFASWDQYTDDRIDRIFNYMNIERGLPLDTTDAYKATLKQNLFALTTEQQAAHTAKQAYLSFGIAIAAAAELKIDATPMEGFDNKQLDELLNLGEKGLYSATILALGYRKEDEDWLVNLKKIRQPFHQFYSEIK
nr:nitroreductase family protein [uncultured Flavobacterium sp.]